ncbi:hypothetical protein GLYMA_03G079700v4 [Glycine max]|uniref:Uncharacterized protein n=2 Tax=Glycine subgen. Soja TaxID=1462606 RepID=A0A0R0KG55_SOYBN|nr:hypothetical protein JHK87_006618 [Glycine soja]KAG5054456.1 hypothetical protein JHK85_006966 [Glycine max]KAG5071557.1 hypothetical protein JHK86_006768 [Glycine max]KAH1069049.1 hypothetical protein GYH30_006582 [Glycine max]KRH66048.1 hypothetical protein GLYMA_03G079700v4 [Glycine max]
MIPLLEQKTHQQKVYSLKVIKPCSPTQPNNIHHFELLTRFQIHKHAQFSANTNPNPQQAFLVHHLS